MAFAPGVLIAHGSGKHIGKPLWPGYLALLTPACLLAVKAIIEHEVKNGIPPNRIILGGFSQVSGASRCNGVGGDTCCVTGPSSLSWSHGHGGQ